MPDPRFDPLFQPLKTGPVTAPNRFRPVPDCTGMGYLRPASLWRADGRGRSVPRGETSFTSPHTLTPDQVLDSARPPQGPVVIFDDEGHHIAAGLAALLASEGFEITDVTPAGTVASRAHLSPLPPPRRERPILSPTLC
jgi:hypothetical protein